MQKPITVSHRKNAQSAGEKKQLEIKKRKNKDIGIPAAENEVVQTEILAGILVVHSELREIEVVRTEIPAETEVAR